jgi:hypothetical protein
LRYFDNSFIFFHENIIGNINNLHHIESLHDASLIVLTFIIACIAAYQLSGIIETGQASFLLEIDKRYSDPSIIRARNIIHVTYRKSVETHPKYSEDEHSRYIGEEINNLGSKNDKDGCEEYVYLLNFLDFLETLSLFVNRGHISINDVNDLMNQSMIYYFIIFEKRIRERRKKYNDDSFYREFEILINTLRCMKSRRCVFCARCLLGYH